MRLRSLALAMSVAVFAFDVTVASAETFMDLYGGSALTAPGSLTVAIENGGSRVDTGQKYEAGLLFGARAGAWSDFLGINVDLSYFSSDVNLSGSTVNAVTRATLGSLTGNLDSKVTVGTIGLNGMLRLQLMKGIDTPDGRVQPYAFGGPTVFVSALDVPSKVAFTDLAGNVTATSSRKSDLKLSLGYTVGGGTAFMLAKDLGFFAEYRFTHTTPEYNVLLPRLTIEPVIDTHHIVGGVTFRF